MLLENVLYEFPIASIEFYMPKWVEMLGLSKEEASAFRYLVKKELGAGESITVFSRLLGRRNPCHT